MSCCSCCCWQPGVYTPALLEARNQNAAAAAAGVSASLAFAAAAGFVGAAVEHVDYSLRVLQVYFSLALVVHILNSPL